MAAEEPDDVEVELDATVVEVVDVVDAATDADAADADDADDETDAAWWVPPLAIQPVSAAAPATLSRPVAHRARFAGCGRRRPR